MLRENRQYDEMLYSAVERLKRVSPVELAFRTSIEYDPVVNEWRFKSFNEWLHLDCATWQVEPQRGMWLHLALLQYLSMADGNVPSGKWISLADCPGGGVRGASFDREIAHCVARDLGTYSEERIRAACDALGILRGETAADVCADFYFMPLYPLRLNLWLADEEFPASGKVLVDSAVIGSLSLEAAGTVALELVRLLGGAAGRVRF